MQKTNPLEITHTEWFFLCATHVDTIVGFLEGTTRLYYLFTSSASKVRLLILRINTKLRT